MQYNNIYLVLVTNKKGKEEIFSLRFRVTGSFLISFFYDLLVNRGHHNPI